MSGSLRYTNPIICEHLASQYVVGVMTPRVRSRIESLRIHVPELDTAIINWSESFSSIHHNLPEKMPKANIWAKVEQELFESISKPITANTDKSSLWNSLRFWQFTGLSASMASIVFAAMLFVFPSKPNTEIPIVNSTPSYLAVMSPVLDETNNKNDISFVVNAYQKTNTSPSKLFIQWSNNQPRSVNEQMHLWAEDRTTGELSYIGREPGDGSWGLDKPKWQAIANSSVLFFTKTSDQPSKQNTLFSGPCIQLGSWKQDLT